jgi:uncharacterized protein YbjT (DUF2867 family)
VKKIVITGSTGTVGQALLSQLLEKEVEVVALTRSPNKIQLNSPKLKVVQADLNNRASYAETLVGAETAFLLTDGTLEMETLQKDFINTCRIQGIPFVVKQSAMGAATDAPVKMFRMHHSIEEHLRASGLAYCLLQPNTFTQNLLAHAQSVKNQGAIYAPLSKGRVSYIDARDVARVAVAVLTNDTDKHYNQTYVLTGPAAVPMLDVAQVIGETVGQEVNYYPVSYEQGKEAMLGFGMDEWLVGDLMAIAQLGAEGQAERITDTFEQVTGEAPRSLANSVYDFKPAFQ